jgi:hypothetical protein
MCVYVLVCKFDAAVLEACSLEVSVSACAHCRGVCNKKDLPLSHLKDPYWWKTQLCILTIYLVINAGCRNSITETVEAVCCPETLV